MSGEFKTPTSKRYQNRIQDNPELQTPIKIPASPFLQEIGYGTGVTIFNLDRSPKVGFIRSPWAIKKRNRRIPESDIYNERIRFEADILRTLSHPNIVGFRGLTEVTNGEPCLAMEKLDASLGDRIEERLEIGDDPFPAKIILGVTYKIIKALEYLHHTAHILHGDIKSFNVLVSKDYKTVKLCDFGVSLPLTDSLEMDNSKGNFKYVGTQCWCAPEIIFDDGPVTNKADIWASGLVVWEMIALCPPHSEISDMGECSLDDSLTEMEMKNNTITNEKNMNMSDSSDLFGEICDTCGTRPPLPAIDLGEEYKPVLEIFSACTTTDYKLRPSAKGLLNYFKKCVHNIDE